MKEWYVFITGKKGHFSGIVEADDRFDAVDYMLSRIRGRLGEITNIFVKLLED